MPDSLILGFLECSECFKQAMSLAGSRKLKQTKVCRQGFVSSELLLTDTLGTELVLMASDDYWDVEGDSPHCE